MALHLAGKVARLISDFLTIGELANLIEHQMEKRIIARHGLVKLDALLGLVARLKNEIRGSLPPNRTREITSLERLIARLRKDMENSDLSTGRDAMAAHALHLELLRIVETWKFMGASTYGVLASDLQDINTELLRLANEFPSALTYPGAAAVLLDPTWLDVWRQDQVLGDSTRPRYASIYPGLGTAGVVAPLPGGSAAQDATIRMTGLATFLRQTGLMLQTAIPRGGEMERLFAEILLNDYCALWELLFVSNVANEHGRQDLCVLDHWIDESWQGVAALTSLKDNPHPDFRRWTDEVRNKVTAHVDPDIPVWAADLQRWPMTVDELIEELQRVVQALFEISRLDVRSKLIVIPPQELKGKNIVGLSNQEGRHWEDN
ncbi:hypothetical protein [Tardiphaga sp. P9-11]|uniref:hypothetical protein n=1 Tax=Tardiphaga sp. P9-11 TaxID=2024614 RepID=UPI0011F24CAC|nr:hypothetical protein [Tardiphaga sp. P9-11]KAA0070012.1 hypothetical protein CIW50_28020 [Tardiphaga sp. P9-11]